MIPIVKKIDGDKLRIPCSDLDSSPVRFTSWKTDRCFPLFGRLTQMWFDESSIGGFPKLKVRILFYSKMGGTPCWDWIPIRDFGAVCSRLNLDLNLLHAWHLEFLSPEDVKDFAPVLFMMVHL